MMLEFDVERIVEGATDMYVVEGRGKTPKLSFVRIDESVRDALVAGVATTWKAMQEMPDEPELFDPSNDYPTPDYLYFPLQDPLAEKARYLFNYINPSEVNNALDVLPRISMYIARLHDQDGRTISAIKSTSDFGRALRKGLLARLSGQELSLIAEPKFQLYSDFDFIIDSRNILIYRHMAFENACNLSKAITDAVKENLASISQQVQYIDFESIDPRVLGSLRVARELAAIKKHDYCRDLSPDRLREYCGQHSIDFVMVDGRMQVDADHQIKFFRLLARKILEIQLRDEGPEYFEVSSRRAL